MYPFCQPFSQTPFDKPRAVVAANVNEKSDDGYTPFHIVAIFGHKQLIELLVAKGADVNAGIEDGETPPDWADRRNQSATADLLRKHGAKTAEELKAEGK